MNDLTTYDQQLARLGEAIAAEGVGRFEAEVAAAAARARRSNVAHVAAGVLADRSAPEVVRERAFALVCLALSAIRSFEPTGPVALTVARTAA